MAASYTDPNEAVTLGAGIRRARRNLGKTLTDLSSQTGVSHSQISRIERGQFKSQSKNVQILCDYFKEKGASTSGAQEPLHLAQRLERLAASSPRWRSVIAALADAMEEE